MSSSGHFRSFPNLKFFANPFKLELLSSAHFLCIIGRIKHQDTMQNQALNLPLIPDQDDETLSEGQISSTHLLQTFSINKYFSFFDILPPVLWIIASCVGSLSNTIIHFLLTIIFSLSTNTPRKQDRKKSPIPFFLLLFSLIYSLAYLLGQLSVYYLTKSDHIKSLPSVLKYFDIYSYRDKSIKYNFINISICIVVFDIIYMIIYYLLVESWYRRAKASILRHFSRPIISTFLISFSLAVSFCPHKFTIFLPILFGVCCLLIGLFSHPFHHVLTSIFWVVILLAIIGDLIFISTEKFDNTTPSLPQWSRILTICITGYLAAIFVGNNLHGKSMLMRIVMPYQPYKLVSQFSPFVAIISALFFSLCQASWVSFSALLAAIIPSFFNNKIMSKIASVTFIINVIVVVTQLIISLFNSHYQYISDITLILPFALTAISALFLSNSHGEVFTTNKDTTSIVDDAKPKILHNLQNIIGSFLMISYYVCSALFASLYPCYLTSIHLVVCLVFSLIRLFDINEWVVLMVITSFSAVSQTLITIMIRFSNFQKIDQELYNLLFIPMNMYTDPIYYSLWPIILLFCIALLIKSIWVPPLFTMAAIFQQILLPILLILPLVFDDKSAFTLLYFIIFMITGVPYFFSNVSPTLKKFSYYLYTSIAFIHICLLLLYNFEFFSDLCNEHIRRIFGLSASQNIAGLICLTLFIFITSYSYKYDNNSIDLFDNKYYSLFKAIFSMFGYYLILIGLFLGVIINHKSSFIHMALFAMIGVARIFTKKGSFIGTVVFLLLSLGFGCHNLVALIGLDSLSDIFENYVGPSITTPLERFVNIVTIGLACFFGCVKPEQYNYPQYFLLLAKFLRRNILVVVQISLGVSALTLDEVLAPISALLLLFLSFRKSIGKGIASFLNVLMLLMISYILFFMIIPFHEITQVTKYLMLNDIENLDVVHSFLHLLTCTLLLDFGLNQMPGFGTSIITAYAFPIIAPITLIFSCHIFDYLSFVHTLFLIILICLVMLKPKKYFGPLITIFIYTILTIFLFTVSHTPWFPHNKIMEKLVQFDKYPVIRICIFAFEFLLMTMIRSDEYNEVTERETERKRFRTQRQAIFMEIKEKDEIFIKEYFHAQLHKLQSDFASFTVEGSYVPYPATANDFRFLNELPLIDENHQTSKVEVLITLFKTVSYYILDLIIRNLMIVIDYNLEPGMSLPGVQKLNQFYDVMLEQYKRTKTLAVPEQWKPFSETIPYSLRQHFRLISRLRVHNDRKIRRFQLLHRYFYLFFRNIVTYMVNILALFYPFVQNSSIISIIWIFLVFITIGLKLNTYKHYFVYSIMIMLMRLIAQLPYIDDLLFTYSISVNEQKRNIPILTLFGLNNLNSVFVYDACLVFFATLSVSFVDKHPSTPSKEKGFNRITRYSPYRIQLNTYIFTIDVIGFLILLFGYGGWTTYGTNIMSMVSGSSSVSPLYVTLLFFYFVFMLCVYVCYLSHNSIFYFFTSLSFALFSFIITLFVIPSISKNQSWLHHSFKFFLFCRLISTFLMSCQIYIGFEHEPPQIAKKRPLFTYIAENILLVCPFLFEFKVVMKWIANKTSISLLNSLLLELVKSKLKARRAQSILWPPEKQESRFSGILFLFAMIFLLFFPLFILSSSSSTTDLNPASIIQTQFGVSGMTSFYQNMLTAEKKISEEQQKQIADLNDSSLLTYYSMSTQQIQVVDLPFGSMEEFLITPDATQLALDQLKDNTSEFAPFGSISLMFKHATTKNAQQIVNFNLIGDILNQEQKENLSLVLSETNRSVELYMPRFIPMFIYVPYESTNDYINNYFYDAIFTRKYADQVDFWHLKTVPSDPKKTPPFLQLAHLNNVTRLVLWSQPTPDKLIGSLLTSTGGIIGLYAFIVLTIGQFITMWIAGLFTDLWIKRMHNPLKLLNALLAIEAYRLEGELDKEFDLSELVLENLRSTTRIIQITDIANSHLNHHNEGDQTNLNPNDENHDVENPEDPNARNLPSESSGSDILA